VAGEWVEDAFSPDQVRVTFFIEPRLDKLFRGIDEYESWRRIQIGPSIGQLLGKLLPGDKQGEIVKNAWRLVIEADSGKKVTLVRPTRADAVESARTVADAVRARGLPALDHVKDDPPATTGT
jgi:hypothetical protein